MRSTRERERAAFYRCSRTGSQNAVGERENEEERTEREKKSCGFSGEKEKTEKQSPVWGTLALHILNKYIIMPAVPSACFQPLPRCLPCTGRIFSPPRKNRRGAKKVPSPGNG